MVIFIAFDPRFHPEQLGFLTGFIDEDDPRPAREQLDANYQHGGGWSPIPGWKLNHATMTLTYPGDPPLTPFAMTVLHDVEAIYFYPYSLVLVLQQDGAFEVARMD